MGAATIPTTSRVLAISNHPYGVIDGLALCASMAKVRDDYKIITHKVLRQAPAVMDKILPIDFDETEAALLNNLKTRADAKKHLKNGGRLSSFPQGLFRLHQISLVMLRTLNGKHLLQSWRKCQTQLPSHFILMGVIH